MKRLLCIVGSMNVGGAETFLMKIYRRLDKTKYQMDFAVAVREAGFYDDEIRKMGGIIYRITPKSAGVIKNFKSIIEVVKNNKYCYVMRISQHSLSALELLAAWIGGAEVRAFRSSNTSTTSSGKINRLLHKVCMFMPALFADVKIAPSTEAAEFMFGKRAVRNNKVIRLHNGLDTDKFTFDREVREQYREELNLGNKLVIGHIGRFSEQKNHKFIIEIFNEIHKKNPEAVLMLVGDGELKSEIENLAEKLGLAASVIFLGVRNDIPKLLSAMDIFLFPSFYEGMPNTVIEAQTSGLPCLLSSSITGEAAVTKLVHFESLNSTAEKWAESLLEISEKNASAPREKAAEAMKTNGYDINDCVKAFENIIFCNQ